MRPSGRGPHPAGPTPKRALGAGRGSHGRQHAALRAQRPDLRPAPRGRGRACGSHGMAAGPPRERPSPRGGFPYGVGDPSAAGGPRLFGDARCGPAAARSTSRRHTTTRICDRTLYPTPASSGKASFNPFWRCRSAWPRPRGFLRRSWVTPSIFCATWGFGSSPICTVRFSPPPRRSRPRGGIHAGRGTRRSSSRPPVRRRSVGGCRTLRSVNGQAIRPRPLPARINHVFADASDTGAGAVVSLEATPASTVRARPTESSSSEPAAGSSS